MSHPNQISRAPYVATVGDRAVTFLSRASVDDGHWVTVDGSHIFIRGGRIEKGPAALVGKSATVHKVTGQKGGHAPEGGTVSGVNGQHYKGGQKLPDTGEHAKPTHPLFSGKMESAGGGGLFGSPAAKAGADAANKAAGKAPLRAGEHPDSRTLDRHPETGEEFIGPTPHGMTDADYHREVGEHTAQYMRAGHKVDAAMAAAKSHVRSQAAERAAAKEGGKQGRPKASHPDHKAENDRLHASRVAEQRRAIDAMTPDHAKALMGDLESRGAVGTAAHSSLLREKAADTGMAKGVFGQSVTDAATGKQNEMFDTAKAKPVSEPIAGSKSALDPKHTTPLPFAGNGNTAYDAVKAGGITPRRNGLDPTAMGRLRAEVQARAAGAIAAGHKPATKGNLKVGDTIVNHADNARSVVTGVTEGGITHAPEGKIGYHDGDNRNFTNGAGLEGHTIDTHAKPVDVAAAQSDAAKRFLAGSSDADVRSMHETSNHASGQQFEARYKAEVAAEHGRRQPATPGKAAADRVAGKGDEPSPMDRFQFGRATPGEKIETEKNTHTFVGDYGSKQEADAAAVQNRARVNAYTNGNRKRGWAVFRSEPREASASATGSNLHPDTGDVLQRHRVLHPSVASDILKAIDARDAAKVHYNFLASKHKTAARALFKERTGVMIPDAGGARTMEALGKWSESANAPASTAQSAGTAAARRA